MPFPVPGTRLSLSLCSPALLTVCDCTLYLYHCLPPERAVAKSMDSGIRLHEFTKKFPLASAVWPWPSSFISLCCFSLFICATSQSNDLLWCCCENSLGLSSQALRTAHSSQWELNTYLPGVLRSVSTLEHKLCEGRDRTHFFTDLSLAAVLAHE